MVEGRLSLERNRKADLLPTHLTQESLHGIPCGFIRWYLRPLLLLLLATAVWPLGTTLFWKELLCSVDPRGGVWARCLSLPFFDSSAVVRIFPKCYIFALARK